MNETCRSTKKIARSNQLNQCRLASLKAREDAIYEILKETQGELKTLTEDPEKYKKLLENLILQALLKMEEQEVSIVCRKEDHDLVSAIIPNVVAQYKEKSGISAKLTVEQKHRLAPGPKDGHKGPTCAGGIVLSALGGRML